MIDLHSHLLPGVDDGSRSVEQSVQVLSRMQTEGVTDICLTPHLEVSRAERGRPAEFDHAYNELSSAAAGLPTLHCGVELMMDRPLTDRAVSAGLTLGRGSHVLIEFPRVVTPSTVIASIAQLISYDLIPLVAHPERYSICSPALARTWRDAGAHLQVDGTTMLASSSRGDRARALLAAGLVDILAADNHGDERTLLAARRALESAEAGEAAELLLVMNPRAVLDGLPLSDVPAVSLGVPLGWWLRRLLRVGEA